MAEKGPCRAEGCGRAAVSKRYCRKHYRLWRRGEMPKPRYKICSAENCRKPRFKGALCEQHWNAAHGKAAAPAAPAPAAA